MANQIELERIRDKALHDEATALLHAKNEGKAEVARNLLNMGLPFHQIIQATGLTQTEVERIRLSL